MAHQSIFLPFATVNMPHWPAFSTSQVYLYTAMIIIITAVVNSISIAALMLSIATCGVESAQRHPMGGCKLLTLGCSQGSDLL